MSMIRFYFIFFNTHWWYLIRIHVELWRVEINHNIRVVKYEYDEYFELRTWVEVMSMIRFYSFFWILIANLWFVYTRMSMSIIRFYSSFWILFADLWFVYTRMSMSIIRFYSSFWILIADLWLVYTRMSMSIIRFYSSFWILIADLWFVHTNMLSYGEAKSTTSYVLLWALRTLNRSRGSMIFK